MISISAILLIIALILLLITVAGFFICVLFAAPLIQALVQNLMPEPKQTHTIPSEKDVPLDRLDPNKPIGIKFSQDAEGRDIMEEN